MNVKVLLTRSKAICHFIKFDGQFKELSLRCTTQNSFNIICLRKCPTNIQETDISSTVSRTEVEGSASEGDGNSLTVSESNNGNER